MYACLVSFYTRFGAAIAKQSGIKRAGGREYTMASGITLSTICIKAIITIGKMKNHQHSKSIRQGYTIIWFYNRRNMSSHPLPLAPSPFLAYCPLTSPQYPLSTGTSVRLFKPFLYFLRTHCRAVLSNNHHFLVNGRDGDGRGKGGNR